MIITLAGAFINIILDPIFIFMFKWGMTGAAAATVIGQVFSAAFAVWYLFHMKAIKLQKDSFRFNGRLCARFLPLGMASLFSQISLVLAIAANNNMIQKYGASDTIFGLDEFAQIPMAIIGIVSKVYQIVISIAIGMGLGCIPIVGYNIGAGRKDRAKGVLTRLIIVEAFVGLAATLAVELFPAQILSVFGSANESVHYTVFGVKAFRIYLCTLTLTCMNQSVFIYLQSLGWALASTLMPVTRQILLAVGLALLLPAFYGLDGVLYSMPAGDIIMTVVTALVTVKTYRTLSRPDTH
jgi:Na+-driven multidrug efflux pump